MGKKYKLPNREKKKSDKISDEMGMGEGMWKFSFSDDACNEVVWQRGKELDEDRSE